MLSGKYIHNFHSGRWNNQDYDPDFFIISNENNEVTLQAHHYNLS